MKSITMNRNQKALELDKILQKLVEETGSEEGAALAAALRPREELGEINRMLAECDAAFVLVAKFGSPSFRDLKNIQNPVRRSEAGGNLSQRELLRVAGTLRAFRALRDWRKKSEGLKNALDGWFQMVMPQRELEEEIFSAILSDEEMADNASPALAGIRRKIRNAGAGIREKLDKLVRSQSHQKHLQDAIVTMRSGRYVVPVKAEHRGEVPGLVHDSSASGATVFIEPMSVVEANNEIRILQSKEKEEIERILEQLSQQVGARADQILESFQYAVQLDLIFAKANLAYRMKAVLPKMNDQGRILVKQGRHPLIDKHKVVPIDISLGMDFDTLMITGPNTGGKTVALKTLGLFTLMAMCGLMIPAAEESELSVFRHILVDIGDEQSIEQSLSTFSAHMTNIIQIMDRAEAHSLVLIDELGAGTDPVEGAALATSIIESLRKQGVRMACTTHYAELKLYALQTEGVENGSCEFDVASLRPTYRLLIGVPGKSNAFAISKRLGMPEEVVTRARELVSGTDRSFEQVIGQLEERRRKMEEELRSYRSKTIYAQKQAEEALKLKRQAESKAKAEVDQAKRAAENLMSTTRARANQMLNELEEIKKREGKAQVGAYKEKMRAGMKALESMSDPVSRRENEDYTLPRPLKAGDDVLIYDIDKKAVVLEEPKGETVLVQAGIMKTRVPIKNLRLLKTPKTNLPQNKQRTVTKSQVSGEGVTDVDLRGKTAEEALAELDGALDLAQLRGIKRLTVIHGKGTGVLRAAVQRHLRNLPPVASFRLGTYGEGESGVTIIELK